MLSNAIMPYFGLRSNAISAISCYAIVGGIMHIINAMIFRWTSCLRLVGIFQFLHFGA